jgi:hypothetical protein
MSPLAGADSDTLSSNIQRALKTALMKGLFSPMSSQKALVQLFQAWVEKIFKD